MSVDFVFDPTSGTLLQEPQQPVGNVQPALRFVTLMSEQSRHGHFWPVLTGIVVFAILMVARYETVSIPARATLGICAFGAIAWGIWKTLSR